jgi:hypothetical protein
VSTWRVPLIEVYRVFRCAFRTFFQISFPTKKEVTTTYANSGGMTYIPTINNIMVIMNSRLGLQTGPKAGP